MQKRDLRLRFMEKFSKRKNGCWLWTAHTDQCGYGRIQIGRRPSAAHRVAYMLLVGPIPPGGHVLHSCDSRSCVNPKHLRIGTHAEIGRYASILEGEGLGKKELAVRLGVSVNYLEACLNAYQEVPKEYREDLAIQTTGSAPEPGKISIHTARAIVNAQKAHGITKAQSHVLYKAAKSDKRFNADNVSKYAAAIKKGAKDPIGEVRAIKTMTFRLMMYESQYDSLMKKYVNDGPFNSFTALLKAVLRGQKQVSINFID